MTASLMAGAQIQNNHEWPNKKRNVTGSEAAGGVALLKGVAPLHFRLAAFRAVKRTIQTKMAATAPPCFQPGSGRNVGNFSQVGWEGKHA